MNNLLCLAIFYLAINLCVAGSTQNRQGKGMKIEIPVKLQAVPDGQPQMSYTNDHKEPHKSYNPLQKPAINKNLFQKRNPNQQQQNRFIDSLFGFGGWGASGSGSASISINPQDQANLRFRCITACGNGYGGSYDEFFLQSPTDSDIATYGGSDCSCLCQFITARATTTGLGLCDSGDTSDYACQSYCSGTYGSDISPISRIGYAQLYPYGKCAKSSDGIYDCICGGSPISYPQTTYSIY